MPRGWSSTAPCLSPRRTGARPASARRSRPASRSKTRPQARTPATPSSAIGRWRTPHPAGGVEFTSPGYARAMTEEALATDPAAAQVQRLPVVPLRDNVVFPHQLAPLAAGRPRSVAGRQASVNADGRVIPGAGAHALAEGQQRVRLQSFESDGEHCSADCILIDDGEVTGTEADALAGSVRQLFAEYVTAGGQVGPEVAAAR